MMYAAVSRAYFYALAAGAVYVKLPEEYQGPEDSNVCGKLRVGMYETRGAAVKCDTEFGSALKEAGYKQGIANPCLFRHEG